MIKWLCIRSRSKEKRTNELCGSVKRVLYAFSFFVAAI
nr:MAG TPA: hypothetical protein [Caudoviricetes sp.]